MRRGAALTPLGLNLALVIAVATGACRRRTTPPAPEPAQRAPESSAAAASATPIVFPDSDGGAAPVLQGSLQSDRRSIELAIYTPAALAASQVRIANDAVKARFPGLRIVSSPTQVPPPFVLVMSPPIAELAPPGEELLSTFGRGLTPDQRKSAAASQGVVALAWFVSGDPHLATLRDAQSLTLDLATKLGGVIWDEATRQMFSRETWKKERIDGWDGDVPDMRRHVTIHYYGTDGDRHRAITLGMEKLGLPDLVLSDVPLAESGVMETLIDSVAQALVEGAQLQPGGQLLLDLRTIRHAAAHDAFIGAAGPKATLRGSIELVPVAGEQGDPDNRLVELRFPTYPGQSASERQGAALESIFGGQPDEMSGAAADDAELAAATKRAQARLPAVAAAFRAGLPLGERIVVKAPFTTNDNSTEWMWVGVTGWPNDVVSGNLENDPARVPSLHVGAKVQVKQNSLADYMWLRADGSRKEGGESVDIFERREGKSPK